MYADEAIRDEAAGRIDSRAGIAMCLAGMELQER